MLCVGCVACAVCWVCDVCCVLGRLSLREVGVYHVLDVGRLPLTSQCSVVISTCCVVTYSLVFVSVQCISIHVFIHSLYLTSLSWLL